MNDDMARKINDIKKPSKNEAEIEEYENGVMEIKNQKVSLIIKLYILNYCCIIFVIFNLIFRKDMLLNFLQYLLKMMIDVR